MPGSGPVAFVEVPEQRVEVEQPGWPLTERCSVAAPAPLLAGGDDVSADRVVDDIADGCEEVFVLLDEDGVVTGLEEVADAAVTAVEAFRVHAIEMAHPPGEASRW